MTMILHTTASSSFANRNFETVERTKSIIKNVDSLSFFMSKHKKKTTPHNPYLDLGCRKISCILASIKMKFNKLNYHLSVDNITENDLFNCGNSGTDFIFSFNVPFTQLSEMIFKWKLCFYQIYH